MTGVMKDGMGEENFMKNVEINETFHSLCNAQVSKVGCE